LPRESIRAHRVAGPATRHGVGREDDLENWTARVAVAFHTIQRAASGIGRRKVKPTPFGENNGKVPFNASGVAQVGPARFVFIDNHESSAFFELPLDADGAEVERIRRRPLAHLSGVERVEGQPRSSRRRRPTRPSTTRCARRSTAVGTAVGRAISLAFLMLQLVSSGGIYPVETTATPFQVLHPSVPTTYAVNGLREPTIGGIDSRLWVESPFCSPCCARRWAQAAGRHGGTGSSPWIDWRPARGVSTTHDARQPRGTAVRSAMPHPGPRLR
jgi:hypothetical protein